MNIDKKGQALIEILIGLTVASILITAASATVVVILRSNLETKTYQAASSLDQELMDNVKIIAEANWRNIYDLTKGTSTQYYVAASGTTLVILSGATTTTVGNITYSRFFYVENVSRLNNSISTDPLAVDDPSTQKITTYIQWTISGKTSQVVLTSYLTRWQNAVSQQTDWSSGSGQEGPVTAFDKSFASSTNIDYTTSTGSLYIQGF